MRYVICFLVISSILIGTAAAQSPIVINEIMFDVPKGLEGDANGDGIREPTSDEFIELVNTGNAAVDISGWQILQKELATLFTFPDGTVLQPGEFCVVFGGVGGSGFGSQFPSTLKVFSANPPGDADSGFAGGGNSNLSNKGGNIILRNAAGEDIAELYWGSASALTSSGSNLASPNTLNGQSISGAIRQSVTRSPDKTGLWVEHSEAGGGLLFSPGASITGDSAMSASSARPPVRISSPTQDEEIKWTADGFIATSGTIFKNSDSDHVFNNETGSYAGMRARLELTASVSKDLYGVLYFEMDGTRFGETDSGRNHIARWGADRAAVEVKRVYVNFKIPGTDFLPVQTRVGVQSFSVRPNVFMAVDAAGIRGKLSIEPVRLTLTPMWARVIHDSDYESDKNLDFYAVDAKIAIKPIKAGAYFSWQDIKNINFLPVGAAGGVINNWKLWWLGGYIDWKSDSLKSSLDLIYNGGTAVGDADADKIDYGSWLFRGIFSYTLKEFEFGLGGMFVQGEDESDADRIQAFQLPRKNSEAPAGNSDFLIITDGWMGSDRASKAPGMIGGTSTSWPGIWNIRTFGYWQAFEWLRLGLQAAYIGDTVINGDAWGTDAYDNSDIGWEFDIGAQFRLQENLTLTSAFGYLLASAALNQAADGNIDDPWVWITSLAYFF